MVVVDGGGEGRGCMLQEIDQLSESLVGVEDVDGEGASVHVGGEVWNIYTKPKARYRRPAGGFMAVAAGPNLRLGCHRGRPLTTRPLESGGLARQAAQQRTALLDETGYVIEQ